MAETNTMLKRMTTNLFNATTQMQDGISHLPTAIREMVKIAEDKPTMETIALKYEQVNTLMIEITEELKKVM